MKIILIEATNHQNKFIAYVMDEKGDIWLYQEGHKSHIVPHKSLADLLMGTQFFPIKVLTADYRITDNLMSPSIHIIGDIETEYSELFILENRRGVLERILNDKHV